MERLIDQKPGTKLRRIDIKSWDSAVAKQHGVRGLPALWLYDGKNRVATDPQQVFMRLVQ